MTSQAASVTRTGTDPSDLLRLMKERGVPLTRDNYLHMAYFGELPEQWTPEHEADLPKQFQDFSQFK